jgi:hypothetical protein
MPVELSARARDRSTFVVEASFTDEEGTPVVPNAVTWTLLDRDRGVVNSRDGVIETPAASITIVLGAADVDHDDGELRRLVLDWTYNSDLGNDLPGREQLTFHIDDIAEKAA